MPLSGVRLPEQLASKLKELGVGDTWIAEATRHQNTEGVFEDIPERVMRVTQVDKRDGAVVAVESIG